jgi:hypothetical protein
MRTRLLAALTVLLTGQGLAFAQQDVSYPSDTFVLDSVGREPCGDAVAQGNAFGFQGSGEFLFWWFKNGRIPPLATAGGDGRLGAPGTQVLVDNLNFDDDARSGGRFALGYHFEAAPSIGIEANYFFLSARQSDVTVSSGGDPVLAQPFLNAATGKPDANLVALPAVATGTVTVGARTGLWGAEANLTTDLLCVDTFHLTGLAGFRFLRLDDAVTSGEQFQVAPNVPGFGGKRVSLQDDFRTVNSFYGGQVGLETGLRLGQLTIDLRGKIALGPMQQVAHVNGATDVLAPDGSATSFQSGLFAVSSNSGRHQRDELALIPEVSLNVGWQLTSHLRLYTGYSLLWVSTVARAGEQIDPVVNVTQVRIKTPPSPLVGPPRPAFGFNGTDFWAQGLNLGLELRY